MRDFSFIHAAEDVAHVLAVAAESGLILRDGAPTARPGPVIIDESEYAKKESGQFVGYMNEWLFGEFAVYLIREGAYSGQYSISPGVNVVGIEFYFMGERHTKVEHRLGNGIITRRVNWYDPSSHEVHPAPPEVEVKFKRICERLETGKSIRAGGRVYHVLEGALSKVPTGYLPPFDYMNWPDSWFNS